MFSTPVGMRGANLRPLTFKGRMRVFAHPE